MRRQSTDTIRRGRLLSTPQDPEPAGIPTGTGGKVLDASARMAWTHGSLALASWTSIAAGLGLTLLVPRAAHTEALLARPGDGALLDVLLAEPTVLVLDACTSRERAEIDDLYAHAGQFHPVARWVISLCRTRVRPALTYGPGRLHRLDPAVEFDLLL